MLRARETWSGLLYIVMGIAAVVLSHGYGLGTLANMGPGLFPLILGIVLIGLGIVSGLEGGLNSGGPIGRIAWWPLLCVVASIVVFGLLVTTAGFGPAVVALALVAFAGNPRPRFSLGAVAVLLAMSVFAILLFVLLLRLPYPLLGPMFD